MIDKKVKRKLNKNMKIEDIREKYAHLIETMVWK